MIYQTDSKRFSEITKRMVKCKCGHSIPFQVQKDRKICNWCNHYCYRTPEIEFKYKLNERGV